MQKRMIILLLVVFCLNNSSLFAAKDGHIVLIVNSEELKKSPCGGIIEAVGVGHAPQGRSRAQARLLAERAAKLRAYRDLLRTVDELTPILENGTVSQTGFIRGARVIEKRFLPNGEVEVKIVADVRFINSSEAACSEWIAEKMSRYGLPVQNVDRSVTEISEKDWVELNQL